LILLLVLCVIDSKIIKQRINSLQQARVKKDVKISFQEQHGRDEEKRIQLFGDQIRTRDRMVNPLTTEALCALFYPSPDTKDPDTFCPSQHFSTYYQTISRTKCKWFLTEIKKDLVKYGDATKCVELFTLWITHIKVEEIRDEYLFGVEWEIHDALIDRGLQDIEIGEADEPIGLASLQDDNWKRIGAELDYTLPVAVSETNPNSLIHYLDVGVDHSAEDWIIEMISGPEVIIGQNILELSHWLKKFQDLFPKEGVETKKLTDILDAWKNTDQLPDKFKFNIQPKYSGATLDYRGGTRAGVHYPQINFDVSIGAIGAIPDNYDSDPYLTVGGVGRSFKSLIKVCRKAASDYIASDAILKAAAPATKCRLQGLFTIFFMNVFTFFRNEDDGIVLPENYHGKNRFDLLVKAEVHKITLLMHDADVTLLEEWGQADQDERASAMIQAFAIAEESELGSALRASHMAETYQAKIYAFDLDLERVRPELEILVPSTAAKWKRTFCPTSNPVNPFRKGDQVVVVVESRPYGAYLNQHFFPEHHDDPVVGLEEANAIAKKMRDLSADAPC